MRQRVRRVKVHPRYDRKPCGDLSETESCNTQDCKVDGANGRCAMLARSSVGSSLMGRALSNEICDFDWGSCGEKGGGRSP